MIKIQNCPVKMFKDLEKAPILSCGHPSPDGGRNISGDFTNTCPHRGTRSKAESRKAQVALAPKGGFFIKQRKISPYNSCRYHNCLFRNMLAYSAYQFNRTLLICNII